MSKQKIDIMASVLPTEVPHITRPPKEVIKQKLDEFIKEETKLVRGIFQCFETPGAKIKISVRKYPGIPAFIKEMTDGMMYEIPLYVARFLNGHDVTAGAMGDPNTRNSKIGTCGYGIHGFKMNNNSVEALRPSTDGFVPEFGTGVPVPTVQIVGEKRRFGFQSTQFTGEAA
jgi:hypothetical protein